MTSNYGELLKDPRWQKKRLEILERDGWMCQQCFNETNTLHVHHWAYSEGPPWETDNIDLATLCEPCHEYETQHRKQYEKDLLTLLRRQGFPADSIFNLMHGFSSLPHIPSVVADVIEYTLTHRDVWKRLEDDYFKFLKEGRNHGKTT